MKPKQASQFSEKTGARALAARLCAAPVLSHARHAAALVRELAAEIAKLESAAQSAQLLDKPHIHALLCGVADHSPFLWHLAWRDPQRLLRLLDTVPEESFETALLTLRADCARIGDQGEIMRVLRFARQEIALLIALCDIGGVWDLADVTSRLTRFADTFVSCALGFLLRQTHDAGQIKLAYPENPEQNCGIVVLALGKHGAGELNYSSDIDLIVFYDSDAPVFRDAADGGQIAIRLTKGLVRLLQERTPDGYVARVDLRLRPDPGATSIAISLTTAYSYYETLGQNWERAAMIKARPIAGDIPLGANFLKELAPFIWRKYFDYAAIADVHAMKRQIHAVRGHDKVTVAGHDIKLGRGGIREIEFFVQTQQLIFGGRRPELRGSRTLDMLQELHRDGWVSLKASESLNAAYQFLRGIEHRLQMLNDEQTQRLPSDPVQLKNFARFCGYRTETSFGAALTRHLKNVEAHYARLFEHAPGLDLTSGSLVFTGTADDPDTLKTLSRMGFREPARVTETVRGWHFGRRAAVQGPRAREVLTELVPSLLQSFAGSGDPDAALAAFDEALGRMPAAVELFSILKSNDKLRQLFADILGSAPRLAEVVAQRPHVLDAAIDPGLLGPASRQDAVLQRMSHLLPASLETEMFLDRARDIAQEEKFLIGVRLLSQVISPQAAGEEYSILAEHFVRATLAHVLFQFERDHGVLKGASCAIIAMGKLGSREMTATSDLDLILLYDFDPARPESKGARPLHASQYYTRVTQRLVSQLTVPTRNGRLYDVDLRLRPSGGKGPLATQLDSFAQYQKNEAETWEHMALTRARVIAGDASLGARAKSVIRDTLGQPRGKVKLIADIVEMRALIAREKGDDDPANLKLMSGGLIDLEFLAQYLVLLCASTHGGLCDLSTEAVFACANDQRLIAASDAERLIGAHRLFVDALQVTQLTLGAATASKPGDGVQRRIAACAGLPDIRALKSALAGRRADVQEIFGQWMKIDHKPD